MKIQIYSKIGVCLFIGALVFTGCNKNNSEITETTKEKEVEEITNQESKLLGFRNYKIGSDLSQFPELVLANQDSVTTLFDGKVYVNPKEDTTIGYMEIKNVQYEFCNNKLCRINFLVNKNTIGITKTLENKYGDYEADYENEVYTWKNANVKLIVASLNDGKQLESGGLDNGLSSCNVTYIDKSFERKNNPKITGFSDEQLNERINDL